jgi:N-methylhydantoinase A/oxoprolinase/acetone carboxylase beta subunit
MRIGADTVGTFTNCVVVEGSHIKILNAFSTPEDPTRVRRYSPRNGSGGGGRFCGGL